MSSLVLHPLEAEWVPHGRGHLSECLVDVGLCERVAPDAQGWCPVGEHFLGLVTFLGCSPAIHLAPDPASPEREYCRVRLREFRAAPHFLHARHLPTPRCPVCRAPVAVDPAQTTPESDVDCRRCGARTSAARLDWRRAAGYASLFIEISGVYPGEALPTDALLARLEQASGCGWRYFYL